MKKKFMLIMFLVVALMVTFVTPVTNPMPVSAAQVFGDLNADGSVDALDLAVVKSHLLGNSSLSNPLLADVNADKSLDALDFSLYKQYLLKLITKFPGDQGSVTPQLPNPIKVGISGMSLDTSQIKTKYLNVTYGNVSKNQTLDIYLPNDISGPFPVIIGIFGGAWLGGSSKGTDMAPIIEGGHNNGYAVVCVNYRLSGEAKFPAAVSDCKAAVRFIRANAAKYGFNPDKIAAWGDSSGGHLTAMLGTTGNVTTLDGDTTTNSSYPSNIQAAVDWFGPTDFTKMDDQFKASGISSLLGSHSAAGSPESQFLGVAVSSNPALAQKANPISYVSTMNASTAPAFFIQHGSSDNLVPYQQSVILADALKPVIGSDKVKLEIIQGAGHGTSEFSAASNITKIFAFLNPIMK
ncbi:acetyl esterase/lipase [Ruminiclostridium sufflavum DSM 19573]|uniref:cellulase n=1 Tax=Ruminiclostridium sufflavum DSM 19573 TaxID=1121337 RepID=A0A318XHZ1_9FIRM|nr:alpha/beta hydrolase fold domain-containing protein [Ruminiclostridium sufflavum]PYG84316.1 acetyl esterase/lipase [Ruminiclostridium sufflavum DSM 19573]